MITDAPIGGPVCITCDGGDGNENSVTATAETVIAAMTEVVDPGSGSPGESRIVIPATTNNTNPTNTPVHCHHPVMDESA
ncbi:hypothetical protein GOALK_097_02020 [Gordonia alkanivorans NBRC 16433]|uniref:Uncharacterized protein n=1 Tax=Gordonia alkanivorans NBRC 16433 TaxID=1027371 RepID=F9VZX7_9ACTN|nr:hypothetical protein GOALK_097_02020 [Gordonia alkanivorans NBRC 16433]